MSDDVYFKKFRKAVQFWMKLLNFNFWGERSLKFSKIIILTGIFFLSVLFTTGTYIVEKFNSSKYERLAESVVFFVVFIRQIVYLTTLNQLWKKSLVKIEIQRNLMSHDSDSKNLARSYSKQEFYSVVFFYVGASSLLLTALSSNAFVEVNEYLLPVNFYLTFLPFTKFSITWIINYVYQVVVIVNGSCFLYVYLPLTMVVLNHSCWQLDETLLLLAKLNKTLDQNPESYLFKQQINNGMKNVVEMISLDLEWQSTVQSLIEFNFFTEFSLLSSIIAMCLFSMSASVFDSIFILCVLTITLIQLYIYCFMGNRVIVRIDTIIAAAYDTKWYLIEMQHRKEIALIIHMVQNMQGFNGILNPLSMETFKKILELSYSILTLLTAIRR